jgi:hypothetical protein
MSGRPRGAVSGVLEWEFSGGVFPGDFGRGVVGMFENIDRRVHWEWLFFVGIYE